jgi:Tfp pilus tip-associated adhesin PilY1
VASCASGGNRFTVKGIETSTTNAPTGTYTTDNNPFNADEWARHLYQNGVPISGCNNQTVSTYTIDVYNAQPNQEHTALMLSMAKVGGGKYFSASNKEKLVDSLNQIFREIQSVNSTFASASLPINATNRAQNENQVFIGTFRPDPQTKPRWFGNVKQYKLINQGDSIVLGDKNNAPAINYSTGFVSECATSFWTSDSGSYWENYPISPSFSEGRCATTSQFNDLPDGPRVEKGAVAQLLRRGNTTSTATWAVNRSIYTANGTTLQTFNTTNTGLNETLVNWVRGQDTENEDVDSNLTETRASIHGDVVHSRPLPVNYALTAGTSNVVVYYGANDGMLRAVDAATGQEKWAFVAPEFNDKLDRLRTQSPLVAYPNQPSPAPTPTPLSRDYFFDGSIGLYQNADNSKVWIFPTMRRGGRMIYALNVTNADSPSIKWKFGCTPDGTCTSGASNIGQTWSIPNAAKLRDNTTEKLAVVMGGGYDTCEDADTATPSCSSPKGNHVYVLNADDGTVIKTFNTLRSVIADVSLIDMNFDGYPDYGYVGDTGGNLYRIAFSSYDSSTNSYSALASSAWSITRVAHTNGGGRKFHFAPALYGAKGRVFIALGSGDRERPLASNYPYTTPVQNRFYVYRDCIPTGSITSNIAGGDNLDDSTIMTGTSAVATPGCNGTQTPVTCDDTNKGWYVNLNNGTGEQTVTTAVIASGLVTFSTNRPVPPAANTCSTQLGEARGYWLNLFSGSGAIGVDGLCGGQSSAIFIGGGLPPSPVVGTVPIDGKPTTVIIGAVQKSGSPSVTIDAQKSAPITSTARKRVYMQIKGTQ